MKEELIKKLKAEMEKFKERKLLWKKIYIEDRYIMLF